MKKYVQEDVMDFFDEIQEVKIKDGKSLKELFFYDNIPLWWFIRPLIIFPTFLRLAQSIDKNKELKKDEFSKLKLFAATQSLHFKYFMRRRIGKNNYSNFSN